MDYPLYNQSAQNIGKVELPEGVFAVPMNKDLLHQVVTSQIANKRQTIAHTKDRSDVRGGGKKPWKQKGTGRARHGSTRSPIWKGGGVTFGPRKERIFKKKVNKNMARKALFVALSSKVKDKEFVVVDSINLSNWKTKEMAGLVKNINQLFPVKHGSILLIIPDKLKDTVERVTKNLSKIDVMEARNLNALDIMARKNLLVMKDAVSVIGNLNK
ncbi:MAG: 50S ribosomal protein L4 [Candidatus Yanofskybacteria bacterium RIFCSPHIGHO2_02_FULL_38_22b]|uniref:Large ribosomal subunit protein uL4 n=1 Tax=Candidatus Yanofskybacteria bacterium RIFCSPHIGHO2_02_FULL_38_22b TaxID=1802673 RepID=A0A1F8F1U6_9BACT|nr:MAG: 50S ribosomal protein L4 [Candidatus Yanofskybacteria bacterium RIFCSPHIGHO2_01_FULL_39_44]OGN07114.1 MAG: 50S ribosomal protein L4 [Candidatus Yanofskybacteria bacterium RIFCSPHIGHO2_02_FULL_38_22b]OGN19964.1 MAG: 50S ribosomal protein L4 [Candidatus Yanofskybacteria bacterium RIFCSPLOWO2_01_FULL_39_28]